MFMALEPKSEDGQALRKLFPLESMPARQFNALCSGINISEKSKGSLLFTMGEEPDSFIYLIQGVVSLEAEEFKVDMIRAGTDTAKYAIAHQFPRQISARAVDNVRYACLQLNAFDKQAIDDIEEESKYMVENEDDLAKEPAGDWMSALLKSPIFQRLPAMNLQRVLMSLEDVTFEKDAIIFNQGDAGNYYYLIKRGVCALSRKASARAKEITLLEIGRNETFGEDALLSDEPRSMTVRAISDVVLARIDKEHFIKLIKEPALSYIDYQQLLTECRDGKAIVVDIRSTDVYNLHHIGGSRCVPFFSLRMSLKELSQARKKIIIICDDGKISKAAAFVLINNGIDAEILEGGIQNVPAEAEIGGQAKDKLDDSDKAEGKKPIITEEPDISVSSAPEQSVNEIGIQDIKTDSGLEQKNQRLKVDNLRLTKELENLKKKYIKLYTQTDKLKSAYDRLQSSR